MPECFIASDYAGVRGGNVDLYYGYEQTDENGEWCFVATEDGVEQMRIPQSKLGIKDSFNPASNLMAGIAIFVSRRSLLLRDIKHAAQTPAVGKHGFEQICKRIVEMIETR